MPDFVGKSLALSADGLADVAQKLGVGSAEIQTVVSVETHGAGFLQDRRPQILFERHFFSRLTQGAYDASHPGISSPTPGGYGMGGANQYVRLAEAVALNRHAALMSASWGIGQVMGANFAVAGFPDVETMVADMCDSEDAQLAAVGGFILGNKLNRFLAVHDWQSFARGYNGANYVINHYDVQLNGFYQKINAGASPDLHVRSAQVYLTFNNLDPHGIDGSMGPGTRSALIEFQTAQNLSQSGEADDPTMAALLPV
ncbi:Peptidoglycan-binding domain 1 protein [Granulicella tundricola MP5ACTX9]|uniref:Peptidoglycan-binding domain 1 protein n=2 Tax=Granulicella TaxID=940557 RepID=E8X5A3_GRATM|nr:Peptidoglycan-binding domain 1 protein [Granulicella tundricola MP5ACTX9]